MKIDVIYLRLDNGQQKKNNIFPEYIRYGYTKI